MGWRPDKDIKKALKKIEDSINQDLYDDILGVEHMSDLFKNMLKGDPTGIIGSNKQRQKEKVDRASVMADQAYRDAQKARDMPFIIANQALAARRKKIAASSLLASGAGGGSLLSQIRAFGKSSLGV